MLRNGANPGAPNLGCRRNALHTLAELDWTKRTKNQFIAARTCTLILLEYIQSPKNHYEDHTIRQKTIRVAFAAKTRDRHTALECLLQNSTVSPKSLQIFISLGASAPHESTTVPPVVYSFHPNVHLGRGEYGSLSSKFGRAGNADRTPASFLVF